MKRALMVGLLALVCCPAVGAGDFAPTIWGLMNPDQATARVGLTEALFEFGGQAKYLDNLPPGEIDAYAAGLYFTWIVNPDGQLPIRGWFPGNPDWLPETVPVAFYIGGSMDVEFHNHNLMPGLLAGARIKTGTHGSFGGELEWYPTADVADFIADQEHVWVASLCFRYQFK